RDRDSGKSKNLPNPSRRERLLQANQALFQLIPTLVGKFPPTQPRLSSRTSQQTLPSTVSDAPCESSAEPDLHRASLLGFPNEPPSLGRDRFCSLISNIFA